MRLDVFSVRLEECSKGMAEGVPADAFVDAVCLRNRADPEGSRLGRQLLHLLVEQTPLDAKSSRRIGLVPT